MAHRLELFMSHVKKSKDCWMWTGAQMGRDARNKYGQFYMGRKLQMQTAHRASWILHNGPIPNNKIHVLHDCDVKLCVRPDHLHLGSNKQNMVEAAIRGFRTKKLNAEKVRAIRGFKGQRSSKEVAKMYGVCYSTICEIWRGRTWGHLK